jgi:hypothetical protein
MKVEAIVAWVQSARTERSLAGWGKAKEEGVTRADYCSSSNFALIDCLPLAISSNFRGQETDFGKEHAQSKLRGPRSPNLSRTSVSFVMEAARNSPSPLSFHG